MATQTKQRKPLSPRRAQTAAATVDLEVVTEAAPPAKRKPLNQVSHVTPDSKDLKKLNGGQLIEAIREAFDLTTQHQQAAVAWAIYTGALLCHARQTLQIPNWKEWIRKHFTAHSYETLNRYRKLYEAVSENGNIPREELLQLPEAPAEERDKVLRKVEKVTGGQSLRQLYFDFDIVKKPDPKGGKRAGAGRPKLDEVAYAQQEQHWWREKILKPLHAKSEKPTFGCLLQADREALYSLFTELADKLKATLQ